MKKIAYFLTMGLLKTLLYTIKTFNFCLVIIGILFGSIKVITGVR